MIKYNAMFLKFKKIQEKLERGNSYKARAEISALIRLAHHHSNLSLAPECPILNVSFAKLCFVKYSFQNNLIKWVWNQVTGYN